jgi:hypothetical protein
VTERVQLGLRENLAQFALLVAVNAFVGAMVGLERSTLPLVGREDFHLTSSAAVLSFIVALDSPRPSRTWGPVRWPSVPVGGAC